MSEYLYKPCGAVRAGRTNHLRLMTNFCRWYLYVFIAIGLAIPCYAQEVEPRRWSHLPIGLNFAGAGYAYTESDISDSPFWYACAISIRADF